MSRRYQFFSAYSFYICNINSVITGVYECKTISYRHRWNIALCLAIQKSYCSNEWQQWVIFLFHAFWKSELRHLYIVLSSIYVWVLLLLLLLFKFRFLLLFSWINQWTESTESILFLKLFHADQVNFHCIFTPNRDCQLFLLLLLNPFMVKLTLNAPQEKIS